MYLYILPNHLISPKNIGPYMTSFTLTLDRHVAAFAGISIMQVPT